MADSLTRMNYYKNHGWAVRINFRGREFKRNFYDETCGGSERARRLAITWRDAVERRVGKPRTRRTIQAKPKKTCGVYRAPRNGNGGPCIIAAFQVRPWITLRRQWSVGKHGARRARGLALAWRHRMERRHYGGQVGQG